MRPNRQTRRLVHWIALLAVWLGALAPTLSVAFGQAGALGLAEVCSAQGSRWVPADDGEPAPGAAAALGHCPFCVAQPPAVPPPDAGADPAWLRQDLGDVQVPQAPAARADGLTRRGAPARAPPSVS